MIKLPADPADPSHHGFTTTPLFASDRLDDAAALQRALQRVLAVCDQHRLRRPTVPSGLPTDFPCRLVVTVRQQLSSHKRVGHLRLTDEDGSAFFGQHWQMATGEPIPIEPVHEPVLIEPAREPPALIRRIRVSQIQQSTGVQRFRVTALHPVIGAGGEFIFGAEPGETGFTETRLRAFLATTYGLSDADIARAVQVAKEQAATQRVGPDVVSAVYPARPRSARAPALVTAAAT